MLHLISLNQTAFVPGRSIGHNVLLARSLCRDYHLNYGAPRFACKLDIRKAFDTLNWSFLFNTMKCMGFSVKFVDRIKCCVTSCTLSMASWKDILTLVLVSGKVILYHCIFLCFRWRFFLNVSRRPLLREI